MGEVRGRKEEVKEEERKGEDGKRERRERWI